MVSLEQGRADAGPLSPLKAGHRLLLPGTVRVPSGDEPSLVCGLCHEVRVHDNLCDMCWRLCAVHEEATCGTYDFTSSYRPWRSNLR